MDTLEIGMDKAHLSKVLNRTWLIVRPIRSGTSGIGSRSWQ